MDWCLYILGSGVFHIKIPVNYGIFLMYIEINVEYCSCHTFYYVIFYCVIYFKHIFIICIAQNWFYKRRILFLMLFSLLFNLSCPNPKDHMHSAQITYRGLFLSAKHAVHIYRFACDAFTLPRFLEIQI